MEMNNPPVICLDCGIDITESYYSGQNLHRCCNRVYSHELTALGALLEVEGRPYNGCIPTEIWTYKGRKLVRILSSCNDSKYTYLHDIKTGEEISLEDLKKFNG